MGNGDDKKGSDPNAGAGKGGVQSPRVPVGTPPARGRVTKPKGGIVHGALGGGHAATITVYDRRGDEGDAAKIK